MIISYSISNFKSIKYKETLNLRAKSYKSKIKTNSDLVSVVSIYGPNGGGKSSLITSLYYLTLLFNININQQLLSRFFYDIKIQKYCECLNEPTEWELEVVSLNNRVYTYKLSITDEIEFESLRYRETDSSSKSNLVFERNKQKVELGKSFGSLKLKDINLGSLVSYLNSNIENEYITDFWNIVSNLMVIDNLNNEPAYLSINPFFNGIGYNLNKSVLINEKDKILRIFKQIDLNINNYEFVKDINGKERFILDKKSGSSNFKMEFANESEGTKKIIQLMSYFVEGLHNGTVFVIDELDSRLHTKLLGYIIDLFHSKENKNSQIIFTSHDMNTLSSKYLRKDEVYFAALNESYFTNLIRLSSFDDVREKSSFSRKYLDGEFGYDPCILRGVNWDDDSEK